MSEDKSTEDVIDNIKENIEEGVESIKENIEDVVENIQETVEEAVDAVEDAVEKAKPPLMKLKEENPKVFYGGIAGVVIALGLFFLSGDSGSSKQHKQSAISIGQTYTLRAPNEVGASSLKILKVPGSMASFDNSEDVVCNAPTGTRVIAKNFQDAFGTKQLFVQVEVAQKVADCRQGAKGWTLKNNLR